MNKTNIKLFFGRRSSDVETGRCVFNKQMVNNIHFVNILDDNSQTEEAVVGSLQKVFVTQQLVLGHIGESREHLLSLGMQFEMSKEDFRCEVGIASSQTPGIADETDLLGAQSRTVYSGHFFIERSVSGHNGVNVIERLLPSGFSLCGESTFLFSSFEEQTSRFLLIHKNDLTPIE